VARGKSKAKFPPAPLFRAPGDWVSIDPASGKKDTMAVAWHRTEPLAFVGLRHDQMDGIDKAIGARDLVVIEGGGFVGANAQSALALERVRERFRCVSWFANVPCVDVYPDHWRSALELAARPRRQAVAAQRTMCRLLGKPGAHPGLSLARQATNDDKRAALLIGWACCVAWNWL